MIGANKLSGVGDGEEELSVGVNIDQKEKTVRFEIREVRRLIMFTTLLRQNQQSQIM